MFSMETIYTKCLIQGNLVDHVFLKADCIASILKHVSHLAMGALPSNSLLHLLPLQNV